MQTATSRHRAHELDVAFNRPASRSARTDPAMRRWQRANRHHAEYPFSVRAALRAIRLLKAPVMLATSQLEIKVLRKDGTLEDYGVVSRRVITTTGVGFIVDAHQNLVELENVNFHAMGTGAVAEAVGDTALGAEVETRTSGTQSEPAANQYRSVATIAATAGRVITEHGILTASSVGVLFDRSVFAAINLANGDSIQFTYTVTYTAGG
jgi:hypothetical protein